MYVNWCTFPSIKYTHVYTDSVIRKRIIGAAIRGRVIEIVLHYTVNKNLSKTDGATRRHAQYGKQEQVEGTN